MKKYDLKLQWCDSPNFLTSVSEIENFFSGRKKYFQTDFYIFQRKRLGILLENSEKPVGGKWTYDVENRRKLPKDVDVPAPKKFGNSVFVEEAKEYVSKQFPDNPGESDTFLYPTTREEALAVLEDFLQNRLEWYGPYQDAMTNREPFVFHSLLTPALNIGLISPNEIIDAVVSYYEQNPDLPLSSVEGFIRQIIGWREFMRAVYVREGVKQRNSNFWDHSRRIPESFWSGTTGIAPVDDTIRKVQKYAYGHHIERLMILGNFMLLCEFDPREIYRWFMALFIDAYDWVMVPNVYGMSQYADEGLITTKPYISSSNYIRKMSDYPAGEWCDVWDGLYWRFIHKHQDFFRSNPRMRMMVSQLDRMEPEKLEQHLDHAESFLKNL